MWMTVFFVLLPTIYSFPITTEISQGKFIIMNNFCFALNPLQVFEVILFSFWEEAMCNSSDKLQNLEPAVKLRLWWQYIWFCGIFKRYPRLRDVFCSNRIRNAKEISMEIRYGLKK